MLKISVLIWVSCINLSTKCNFLLFFFSFTLNDNAEIINLLVGKKRQDHVMLISIVLTYCRGRHLFL
jgi:hypothetical protein